MKFFTIFYFFLDVLVDVDEFVSSSEQILRNVAVHTLHTNGSCSERVPSELVQTTVWS